MKTPIPVRHHNLGYGRLRQISSWVGNVYSPDAQGPKDLWNILVGHVVFKCGHKVVALEDLEVFEEIHAKMLFGEEFIMMYYVSECPKCQKTHGGSTNLPIERASMRCKRCLTTSLLKCPQRPDGAYVWYFGSSLFQAQELLKNLKSERKK